MKKKPIDKNGGIFADGLGKRTGMMALVLTIITLIGFYIGSFIAIPGQTAPSLEVGRTMAFIINAWSSVINSFNVRSYTKSLFKIGFKSNRWLSYGILFSISLTAVVATTPFLANVFYCVPLTLHHWIIMAGLAIVPLIVGELHKLFFMSGNRVK